MKSRRQITLSPLNVGDMELLPDSLLSRISGGGDEDVVVARQGVHGDGSCFFHSLCSALNTDGYLTQDAARKKQIGTSFRCAFVKQVTRARWESFLAKKRVKTSISFEKLQAYFCNNRHWADEIMIRLVSDVLNLNLVFLNVETHKLYCGVHGLLSQPLILILWVRHSHFEPVFRVRAVDVAGARARVQFVFNDPVRDAAIVNRIVASYNQTCARDVLK